MLTPRSYCIAGYTFNTYMGADGGWVNGRNRQWNYDPVSSDERAGRAAPRGQSVRVASIPDRKAIRLRSTSSDLSG